MAGIVSALVRLLFLILYYVVAVPICVVVFVFWLVRLAITIIIMVFAMLVEAWRKRKASDRPIKTIENVLNVGPDVIRVILKAPFNKETEEQDWQGSELLFEIAYAALFIAAAIGLLLFKGYVEAFGGALSIPLAVFQGGGIVAKLGAAYVFMSFIVVFYMLLRNSIRDGPFKSLIVPAYLIISGFLLVIVCFNAAATWR